MEPTPTIPAQNNYLVPVAIVVAGAFIAGAIYFGGGSRNANTNIANNPSGPVDVAPVTEKDHIIGSRSAELVIVEYSDTECPFCKVFHETMKEVVKTYDKKVSWVYRHFPIVQLHAKAPKEAEATECAAELAGNQGFWNYVNKIFETTKSNDSLDPSELPKIAKAIGLDESAFNNCLNSGKYADFITKSIEAAVKAGARGTPYSIIITKGSKQTVINGAESLASVKTKIDALLK